MTKKSWMRGTGSVTTLTNDFAGKYRQDALAKTYILPPTDKLDSIKAISEVGYMPAGLLTLSEAVMLSLTARGLPPNIW